MSVVFLVSTRLQTSFKEFPDSRTDHGIRNLCDDQTFLSALHIFYFNFSTDLDLSGSCLV